jgi:hypothetical protein
MTKERNTARLAWATGREPAGAALLIMFGAFILYANRMNEIGVATQMGPGYFPMLVGFLIVLLGASLLLRSLLVERVPLDFRPVAPCVVVVSAILVFAYTLDRFGLVLATILLVAISRLAARPYRVIETGVIAVALAAASCVIFVVLFSLPIKAW